MCKHITACGCVLILLVAQSTPLRGQSTELGSAPDTDVLSEDQWSRLDNSVARGLTWLAKQQQPDGSFPTVTYGQPGVTSLCVLAFLAHGHLPGSGPHGELLENAVSYIASCQKPNGLVAIVAPGGKQIIRNVPRIMGGTAVYNHGVSSLALSEVYASTQTTTAEKIESIIENSIEATLTMQRWPKARKIDEGGWRYLDLLTTTGEAVDSNLSNTIWQMLFLRSAKNAGFDVSQEPIDGAVRFIKSCFHQRYRTFVLMPSHSDHRTRGMSGAGVMALALAGMHESPEARAAGDWILEHDFNRYNYVEPFGQIGWLDDRYHYGVFFCTQASYQLGGKYWREFFPPVVNVVIGNQRADGSWVAESHSSDNKYGNSYTTSLMLLTLGAPNQLLPVLQR